MVALTVGTVLLVTGLIWLGVGMLPRVWYPRSEQGFEQAAQFGDSYGYVNALLSSLALGGALAAIILQTIELRWQRKELQESQDVWREQTRQAEAQARQQELQASVMADQVREINRQNQIALLSILYNDENEDAKLANSVLQEMRAKQVKPLILETQSLLRKVQKGRNREVLSSLNFALDLAASYIQEISRERVLDIHRTESKYPLRNLRKTVFALQRFGLSNVSRSLLDKADEALVHIAEEFERAKHSADSRETLTNQDVLPQLRFLGGILNTVAKTLALSEDIDESKLGLIPPDLLGPHASLNENETGEQTE